jgi:hypothetical protein
VTRQRVFVDVGAGQEKRTPQRTPKGYWRGVEG